MSGYMLPLCNKQEKVHFLPSFPHHNFPTEGKRKKGERSQKEKNFNNFSNPTAFFYPF